MLGLTPTPTETEKGDLSRELPPYEANSTDPYSIFLLAIRSPVTREKYIQRIGYFFDFLKIPKFNDCGITSFNIKQAGGTCSI